MPQRKRIPAQNYATSLTIPLTDVLLFLPVIINKAILTPEQDLSYLLLTSLAGLVYLTEPFSTLS